MANTPHLQSLPWDIWETICRNLNYRNHQNLMAVNEDFKRGLPQEIDYLFEAGCDECGHNEGHVNEEDQFMSYAERTKSSTRLPLRLCEGPSNGIRAEHGTQHFICDRCIIDARSMLIFKEFHPHDYRGRIRLCHQCSFMAAKEARSEKRSLTHTCDCDRLVQLLLCVGCRETLLQDMSDRITAASVPYKSLEHRAVGRQDAEQDNCLCGKRVPRHPVTHGSDDDCGLGHLYYCLSCRQYCRYN